MTIIAAHKSPSGIWMAGDSRASDLRDALTCTVPKIISFDGFTVGFAGSFRVGQMIQYSFKPPTHKKSLDTDTYMNAVWIESFRDHLEEFGVLKTENNIETMEDAGLIVAYRGEIYIVQEDLATIKPLEPFAAIGIGAAYALGVMWALRGADPEQIVKRAVECACEHSPYCGGPVLVVKHVDDKKAKRTRNANKAKE